MCSVRFVHVFMLHFLMQSLTCSLIGMYICIIYIGCNRETCSPKIEIESHQIPHPVDESVHKVIERPKEREKERESTTIESINANCLCRYFEMKSIQPILSIKCIPILFIRINCGILNTLFAYHSIYLNFRVSNIFSSSSWFLSMQFFLEKCSTILSYFDVLIKMDQTMNELSNSGGSKCYGGRK